MGNLGLTVNKSILNKLIENANNHDFTLQLDNKTYGLQNVTITKSSTPVTKPMTRGGVYFTDTNVYKIKAATTDLSIVPMFSKVMLGPNTDFKELELKTSMETGGKKKSVTLLVYLTNTMQSSLKVELNMVLMKIISE